MERRGCGSDCVGDRGTLPSCNTGVTQEANARSATGSPGQFREVGEGAGRGFTLNLPMPRGLGDADYSRAYREIVEPVGRAFDPQLVLVSAGFDAHEADPLGGMQVTDAGFAELMDVCVSIASGSARGRVVAVLEGGYSLEGLAASTAASVGRLLDRPSPPLAPGVDSRTEGLLTAYRKAQTPFWPVLEK